MKLNTLALVLTLASAASASATTLDMVTVSTNPATTGQASFNWAATGHLTSLAGQGPALHQAISGGGLAPALLNSTVVTTGGNPAVGSVVLFGLPPGPGPLLVGSVTETRISGGNIEVLLDQLGGSSSANYGDYLLLTLLTAGTAFDDQSDGAHTTGFTLYGAEATVMAPVPLPASMLLLLGGVAGFARLRRRG